MQIENFVGESKRTYALLHVIGIAKIPPKGFYPFTLLTSYA